MGWAAALFPYAIDTADASLSVPYLCFPKREAKARGSPTGGNVLLREAVYNYGGVLGYYI
jgi:hypothetical protein